MRKRWISGDQLVQKLATLGNAGYTQYLQEILLDPGHKNPNICVD